LIPRAHRSRYGTESNGGANARRFRPFGDPAHKVATLTPPTNRFTAKPAIR